MNTGSIFMNHFSNNSYLHFQKSTVPHWVVSQWEAGLAHLLSPVPSSRLSKTEWFNTPALKPEDSHPTTPPKSGQLLHPSGPHPVTQL